MMTVAHKTTEQVQQELLRLGIVDKRIINDTVRRTLLQIGDPIFLDILRNATNIRSIDDVYDKVLNAIPGVLSNKAGCRMYYQVVKTSPLAQVCNTILRNLSNDDVQNIIIWAYNEARPEAQIFKSLVKAETSFEDKDLK